MIRMILTSLTMLSLLSCTTLPGGEIKLPGVGEARIGPDQTELMRERELTERARIQAEVLLCTLRPSVCPRATQRPEEPGGIELPLGPEKPAEAHEGTYERALMLQTIRDAEGHHGYTAQVGSEVCWGHIAREAVEYTDSDLRSAPSAGRP